MCKFLQMHTLKGALYANCINACPKRTLCANVYKCTPFKGTRGKIFLQIHSLMGTLCKNFLLSRQYPRTLLRDERALPEATVYTQPQVSLRTLVSRCRSCLTSYETLSWHIEKSFKKIFHQVQSFVYVLSLYSVPRVYQLRVGSGIPLPTLQFFNTVSRSIATLQSLNMHFRLHCSFCTSISGCQFSDQCRWSSALRFYFPQFDTKFTGL